MIAVQEFFDKTTNTLSYIVYDPDTRDAVILDPVLDFDAGSGRISTESVAALVAFVGEKQLKVGLILETHAHADHLSGSQELKRFFPGVKLAVSTKITLVQKLFRNIYNYGQDFPIDGRQFDRLLHEHEKVAVGSLSFEVIFTPGHTPACTSFRFADMLFVGDTLFMPDYGTGRCDFPGGSASELYDSITQKIYSLPDATRIYTCHDYMPKGRPLRFMATVAEQKAGNIQLNAQMNRDDFVHFRIERDKKLDAPRLLHPSVQVNIDAGNLPKPESNGVIYLRTPLMR